MKLAAAVVSSVVFSALSAISVQAQAQDKITLRLSSINPAASVYETQGSQFLMKRITELTGGSVTFEYYPAGQLAAPEKNLSILESGVADMAYIGSAYDPDKLPLTSMLELPGLYSGVCQGTVAYNAVAKSKVFTDNDWSSSKKYIFLFGVPNPPAEIETAAKEIKTPKDLSGLKVRVAGAGSAKVVTTLGGVPVRVSAGDTYQSLQRGTVDATMWSWNAHVSYDTYRLTKFTTGGLGFGGTGSIWVINRARWEKLPASVQNAIVQASAETSQNECKAQQVELDTARKTMADAGVTVSAFDPAAVSAFHQALAPVIDDWAKNLDSKGIPAKQAIEAFKAQLPAQ